MNSHILDLRKKKAKIYEPIMGALVVAFAFLFFAYVLPAALSPMKSALKSSRMPIEQNHGLTFQQEVVMTIRQDGKLVAIELQNGHIERVVQLRQNASILEQGCAGFSPGSSNRCDQFTRYPGRTSSPLRPRLSCRYTHLVAELGARPGSELAITIEPRADQAQYLSHWLTVLKADKQANFTVSSKAAGGDPLSREAQAQAASDAAPAAAYSWSEIECSR